MCGIAGVIHFGGKSLLKDRNALQQFAEPLKFRGPDAEGYYSESKEGVSIQFAHRRLSIIDLSEGGNQPMFSPSGKSIIVFNGEIYNYQTLKQELVQKGAVFHTDSDTEVLLNGYEIWGVDTLLDKIDGMFAFGLYSFSNQELVLARDRFGKKPLYYYADKDMVVFSSDIRSFNTISEIPKTLNRQNLGYFFSELSASEPQSIWSDINKVPASHYGIFSKSGEAKFKQYWTLTYTSQCKLSQAEILEQTDYLLTEAVKKRLVADVNVAAQVSGGIDSSLIAAKMALESKDPIATYSVGFEDKVFNELPYARMVADRYKTNHHEMIMQPADIEATNQLILEYGEPFADVSMIPSYMIARYISQSEKVVCGGDGGDELFAGYYIYYFGSKFQQVKGLKWALPLVNIAAKIAPIYRVQFLQKLLKAAKQPEWMLLNRNMGFSPEELGAMFGNEPDIVGSLHQYHKNIWTQYDGVDESTLKILLRASLDTRLLNDYLVKVDRASMFASLEMRSPFLDRQLAEFAFSLHDNQLFKPHGTKSILKILAERYLPKELIYRNKMGFGVPIGDWFRKELSEHFKAKVLGGKQAMIDMNYTFVEDLFNRHCAGEDHTHKLWTLYVFHTWAQNQGK